MRLGYFTLHAGATRLRQLSVEANPERAQPVTLQTAEALDGGRAGPCAVEAWAVMQVQGCGTMPGAELGSRSNMQRPAPCFAGLSALTSLSLWYVSGALPPEGGYLSRLADLHITTFNEVDH